MNKKTFFYPGAFCILLWAFSSCAGFESWFPSKETWASVQGMTEKGNILPGTIYVDSLSLKESLEKEIRGILPLLFLEKGYRLEEGLGESGDEKKIRRADVSLIEREYMEGWQTRRSLSAEVRIWDPEKNSLPAAAGRAMVSGNISLASSKVTAKLLRAALSQALSALEKNGN